MSGDTVTLGVVQRWCHEYERALRTAFANEDNPQGALLPEWESILAEEKLQPTSLRSAVLRYGQLCRWYGEQASKRQKVQRTVDSDEAKEAARQILARDPVYAVLAGRRVKVTSRSYAAMAEIAAHEQRIRLLTTDLNRVAHLYSKSNRRRRRRWLEELHRRVYGELLAHRRALYAHALTPHGGRAKDPAEEAPEWWDKMGPEDDARLFIALVEAGPGRYAKLGKPPEPKDKKTKGEDFGFITLLATWEKTLKLRPAELYDEDLAQILLGIRASMPTLSGLED